MQETNEVNNIDIKRKSAHVLNGSREKEKMDFNRKNLKFVKTFHRNKNINDLPLCVGTD